MRKNLSINSKRFIKTLCIGLSVYMALSPATALAAEVLEETPNDDVQEAAKAEEAAKDAVVEAAKEEAAQAVEAAQATANDENRAEFVEAVKEQNIPSENEAPAEEVTAPVAENPVQEEIKKIEEETIKEAVDNIVKVDMSNVDSALDQISEFVEETLTDEDVAKELETVADTLIEIYDTQANNALEALKALDSTDEEDSIIVNEDGTVDVDWAGATEEIKDLYQAYMDALDKKVAAEDAKKEAANAVTTAETEKETAISAGETADEKAKEAQAVIDELDDGILKNNKDKNKTVAKSKADCDTIINELIAQTVAANKTGFTKGDTINGTGAKNQDIYRFFVNTIVDGEVYGCLTYYDHASNTILRKNFKVDKEGSIDYTYEPKAEWTKGDAACKESLFGNGSNYIAAYVGAGSTASSYFLSGSFNGSKVSDLMRANQTLNEAIDRKVAAEQVIAQEAEAKAQAEIDKNKALEDIEKTKATLEEAQTNLNTANANVQSALDKYNEVVAKYAKAGSLSDEIKKNEVEKAKQEYVKAEIEAWKKQQIVDAVDKAIEELEESKKETSEEVKTETKVEAIATEEARTEKTAAEANQIETEAISNVDDLIVRIAENLNLAEEAAEELVVQAIYENIEDVQDMAEITAEAKEKITETYDVKEEIAESEAEEEITTIEEEETALAATLPTAEEKARMSWWWLLIVAICGTTGYTWYKNHQKKVETEEA